jgi:hypothetical protein
MKKILITILATFALSGASYAGSVGIGISGSMAKVDATGSETTLADVVAGGTADKHSTSVNETSVIGSIFLDYQFDNGVILGVSHVPGSADVSGKTHQRAETAQGVSGTDATGSVTRKAAAEVENFNTVYVEYPIGSFFTKLGIAQLDVITKENVVTSSGTYGNKTLTGYTVGAGYNYPIGDYFTKTAVEYTDFEDLALHSSTGQKIDANLDVTEFKISIGKRF